MARPRPRVQVERQAQGLKVNIGVQLHGLDINIITHHSNPNNTVANK